MEPPRRLAAQVLMAIAALAMFLTWVQTDLDDSVVGPSLATGESVTGMDVGEGQLAFIASLLTIVLIQTGLRPAWMGAGFVFAVVGRQLVDTVGDDLVKPGNGLWIGTFAALVAAVALFADMFSSIDRTPAPPVADG